MTDLDQILAQQHGPTFEQIEDARAELHVADIDSATTCHFPHEIVDQMLPNLGIEGNENIGWRFTNVPNSTTYWHREEILMLALIAQNLGA